MSNAHGGSAHRDNNMRAAIVHVLADAAVSVLVIVGLLLGRVLGWTWMDPVVGFIGAVVIAAWAYTLVRDTSGVLLDINPDRGMAQRMRAMIESDGDRLTDLHLWRLGPGHRRHPVGRHAAPARTGILLVVAPPLSILVACHRASAAAVSKSRRGESARCASLIQV
jgi:Co/Zn/Cd efflux system component